MAIDTININEFRNNIGRNLGVSDWLTIEQKLISDFGVITKDLDPMHIDPPWAEKFSPFKSTVAFGFLTISLVTYFYHDVLAPITNNSEGTTIYGINYGFDRVRLIEPIHVNSRIRAHFTILDVTDRSNNEIIVKLKVEIEVEGTERMAMIAEWLTLLVTEEGSKKIATKQKNVTC